MCKNEMFCFLFLFSSFYQQRDTNGLTNENSELKVRLQSMEQQVHLQDGKTIFIYFCRDFHPILAVFPLFGFRNILKVEDAE